MPSTRFIVRIRCGMKSEAIDVAKGTVATTWMNGRAGPARRSRLDAGRVGYNASCAGAKWHTVDEGMTTACLNTCVSGEWRLSTGSVSAKGRLAWNQLGLHRE